MSGSPKTPPRIGLDEGHGMQRPEAGKGTVWENRKRRTTPCPRGEEGRRWESRMPTTF